MYIIYRNMVYFCNACKYTTTDKSNLELTTKMFRTSFYDNKYLIFIVNEITPDYDHVESKIRKLNLIENELSLSKMLMFLKIDWHLLILYAYQII